MTPGDRIIQEARSWLGTPFVKGQRTKGKGCDCSGLIFGVARELGIKLIDDQLFRGWDRQVFRRMADFAGKQLIAVPNPEIGDVMMFRATHWHKSPTHMAIKSPVGMIHTWTGSAGVVEHGIKTYETRYVCSFRYPWPQ